MRLGAGALKGGKAGASPPGGARLGAGNRVSTGHWSGVLGWGVRPLIRGVGRDLAIYLFKNIY